MIQRLARLLPGRRPALALGTWASTTAIIVACGEPRTPVPMGASSVTSSAPPIDSSAPLASVSTPAPPVGPPSPFHLLSKTSNVELFPLVGGTLAVGPGIGTFESDATFRFDGSMKWMSENSAMSSGLQVVGGRYPSMLLATRTVAVGRTGIAEIFRWKSSGWEPVKHTEQSVGVAKIVPYIDGSALLVEQGYFMRGYQLRVVGGTTHTQAPKLTPWKQAPDEPAALSRLTFTDIDALESGNMFVVGGDTNLTEPNSSGLVVERLSPGKAAVVDQLPIGSKKGETLSDSSGTILAASETDVWVSGSWEKQNKDRSFSVSGSYLAHFDGKTWAEAAAPTKSDGFRLRGKDGKGTIWATAGKNELWKRPAGGEWTLVPLPSSWPEENVRDSEVGSVTVLHDGNVILEMTLYGPKDSKGKATIVGSPLLSLTKPPRLAEIPSDEAYKAASRKFSVPKPPSNDCMTPFVLLYQLSKVAPAAFDYPATRKALTGHTEFSSVEFIEFTRDGQRFFGARFPADDRWDWVLPKKMVDLVKKGVPGSGPQMVCHDPEGSRVLKIDLKTGAIVP